MLPSPIMPDLNKAEAILKFLYQIWWRVEACGFEKLPEKGPAVIAGNTSGYVPWPALMLIYILMSNKTNNRTIHVLIDMDNIKNEKLSSFLQSLNFISWSYDNAKQLLDQGELIAIFPEDSSNIGKTISMRNRLKRFDWTKFLPAIEAGVPVFPLSTLGVDEANLTFHNNDFVARLLDLKAFPVSPFIPWLSFPFNLATLPVPWKMHLLSPVPYEKCNSRDAIEEQAKKVAFFAEGDIQAQINSLLRARHRLF